MEKITQIDTESIKPTEMVEKTIELDEKQTPIPIETSEDTTKSLDTNLTISTKLSTDQLICKTPQDSSTGSIKSTSKRDIEHKSENESAFYLGILQILFGLLMVVFGVVVIIHQANLGQIGGGIWGGGLAIATGSAGLLAGGRKWCPLKNTAKKIAHTIFLALSLISLAISQLVVVLAATGLARDLNSVEIEEHVNNEREASALNAVDEKISILLPANYQSLLANIGLLIVSSIECICAAVSSYKSARDICPCFKKSEEHLNTNLAINNSHAIVSSWLGKHSGSPAPLYFVAAAPSSLGKGSKLSGSLTPVFAIPQGQMMTPQMMTPQMMAQQIVGYPLIPAPLGSIPSPIIPPPHKDMILKRQRKHASKNRYMPRDQTPSRKSRSKSRSKSVERPVTEEDVARTYTGLDRTIAEEFIDICDSRNNSVCSDSSCTSSCRSPCTSACNLGNSDAASREYLVNKP